MIGVPARTGSVLCMLCTACASPRAPGQNGLAIADTVPVIVLERESCRGTCPVYRLALFSDGRAAFTGVRHVTPLGADSTRIARADVTTLRDGIAQTDFASLPERIEYGTPSCGSYATDLPTVVITAVLPSGTHRVRFDEGCRNVPPMLSLLAARIDSTAGITRWTHP